MSTLKVAVNPTDHIEGDEHAGCTLVEYGTMNARIVGTLIRSSNVFRSTLASVFALSSVISP